MDSKTAAHSANSTHSADSADSAASRPTEAARAHWQSNRRLMAGLLVVWFVVPCLLGIVFVEPLNQFRLGGFPLGFWFAQQGSIYVFVVLIAIYAIAMERIDRRYEAAHDDLSADEAKNS